MIGRTSERGLDAGTLKAILATHGFSEDHPAEGALLVALTDPLRLVWANPQATALFGTADTAQLHSRLFAGQGREALTTVIGHLVPNGGIRMQRLRLIDGFRTRSVTVAVSRSTLADGADAVLLAIPATGASAGHAGADGTRNALDQGVVSDAAVPAPSTSDEPAEPSPALAALGSRRFLWQTDGAGYVRDTSDVPVAVPALAALVGRRLSAVAGTVGADPDGALASALASAANWSGVKTFWPVAEGWAVPIAFGAAVVRDRDRKSAGFRGFGVADFARIVPRQTRADEVPSLVQAAPDTLASALLSPSHGASDEPAPDADATGPVADPVQRPAEPASPTPTDALSQEAVLEPVLEPVLPDAPVDPADGPLPATSPPPPPTRSIYASANVVMLRPAGGASPDAHALSGGDTPLRRLGDASTAPSDLTRAELSHLSSAEQLAFDAIARALKASAAHKAASSDVPQITDAEAAAMWGALPLAVVVTCNGRLVFSNSTFAAITGYVSTLALEEAGGRAHLLGGLDVTQVAEPDVDRTFPIVDASGGVLSVEGRVATLPWDGDIAEMLTFRPAADHVAEVQALQLQIARLRTEAADAQVLLDRVADAAAIVDGQGRLLSLNATGARLFGREAGSTVGESIGILLTPESQNAALGAIFAAGNAGPDGGDSRITVSGRRREGENRLALAMVTRALGHGRIGVVFHDGSDVEAARSEARHLRDELGQTGAARIDFLAKVSHEIRTPLNAILGFTEIMLDERFGPIGNPRYKDYLGDISSAGRHVNDLVADLLDLSSVQAGQRALTVVASDVNRIVGESVADLQAQAHRDRVIVRLSLMTHLPTALVDEAAMRQVMDNILSNAIRFNEPGGQVIVSTAVTEGGAITVRVRDTGIGMTEAELAIATEPFRQISTGKPAGGSGLGLPLTQALVEANGARMTIASRKREGTLVEVVLRSTPDQSMSVPAA